MGKYFFFNLLPQKKERNTISRTELNMDEALTNLAYRVDQSQIPLY